MAQKQAKFHEIIDNLFRKHIQFDVSIKVGCKQTVYFCHRRMQRVEGLSQLLER